METLGFVRSAAGMATAAILAACAGAQVAPSAPSGAPPGAAARGTAPMSARAWLYTSGIGAGGSVVVVYAFPSGKFVRQFGQFFGPTPMCVDGAGDLFVLNSGIFEHKPGGRGLIETLEDRFSPTSCAVDPSTGNLAVTNVDGRRDRAGAVAIYAGAKGAPTYYFDRRVHFVSGAYDDAGNLFVDGDSPRGAASFAELPSGSSHFVSVQVRPSIDRAGSVRWDGSDFAVGDGRSALIRRVKLSGTQGRVVGTTRLGRCVFTDFVLLADSVAAACGSIDVFRYPAGGSPTKVVRYLHPGDLTFAIGR